MKESKVEYWKWKSTIIDFDVISNETVDYDKYITKKDYIFHYLGTPDNLIHEWYNGGFSSEYNTALRYAKQLGLVEKYIDYEDKIYELTQENKKQKEVIDKAIEYVKENTYSYYDNKGEKCIEETIFERNANPKELLDILNEVSE